MKTTIYSILFCTLLVQCEEAPVPRVHHLTVITDRTEKGSYAPTFEQIRNALPKDISLADGINITLVNVTDIRYSPRQHFVLDRGAGGWLANDNERSILHRSFFRQVEDSLSASHKQDYDFGRSDIYRTVISEINALAGQEGSKTLLLYSDLKEHSFFSVYKASDRYALEHQFDKVVTRFVNEASPKQDLGGVHLYIRYQPSVEDASLYSNMLRLYRAILKPKGCVVVEGINQTITVK